MLEATNPRGELTLPPLTAPRNCASVFLDVLKPGGRLPMLDRPEDIRIIVAGCIPGYFFDMNCRREGLYAPTSNQTKKIRGATFTTAG
jgi:hypothetical protein